MFINRRKQQIDTTKTLQLESKKANIQTDKWRLLLLVNMIARQAVIVLHSYRLDAVILTLQCEAFRFCFDRSFRGSLQSF